jgi:hypothetical protein
MLSNVYSGPRGGPKAREEREAENAKKRILAAALALCLLLAVMPAALAAGTTLTLQTPETPAVGESFTVTVAIAGNPGVNAIQMTLAYDKSVVNCTKAQIGSVLKGALSVTNEKAHNGAKVVAASVDALDSNGTIATFILRC